MEEKTTAPAPTTPPPASTPAATPNPPAPPPASSTPPATPPAAATTPPTHKSNKMLWIIIAIVVVVALGAVGYFWMVQTATKSSESMTQKTETKTESQNTITIWAWNTAAKSLQELVPAFNKKYPDIKVTVVDIPYTEANKKFRQAVSSGTGLPDVWDSEGPVTEEYAKAGALLDLTTWATPYKADFVEYKWSEVSVGEKIYALPWDSAPVAVFYRKDLFDAAGVKAEDIKTWDDYIAAGKKITKDTNGDGKPDQYMAMISPKADVQDTFEIFLAEMGGSLFDSQGKISFNSKEGVAAVVLMKKIIDSGIAADIGWWTPEFFNSFKTGSVASYMQGVWLGGQIKENAPATTGKWAVFPLPAVTPGGLRSAVNGGSNLAIPTKAKHPDLAWKFIEFALTNKENQLAMYKNYNIFPALKSAYTDPVFNEANPFFGNQKTSEVFIQIQEEIPTTWHYGQYYNEITSILSTHIVKALNGSQTPEQALAAAEKDVDEFIKGTK
jgi:lactose/L-arabinose transport system substrate-binding protein